MAANPNESPRHYYSLDEYFALENAGHTRYEYWDGDIVCMSGSSRTHGRIAGNVYYRLRQRLEGGSCQAFTAETAVKTPTLLPYRYPDVSAACGDLKYESMRGVDALLNPILIVEVLSPTTSQRDHEEKFTAYKAIAGFQEYLLIAQEKPHVTHYTLQAGGLWTQDDISDLSAALPLDSVACVLPMREIYERVTFDSL